MESKTEEKLKRHVHHIYTDLRESNASKVPAGRSWQEGPNRKVLIGKSWQLILTSQFELLKSGRSLSLKFVFHFKYQWDFSWLDQVTDQQISTAASSVWTLSYFPRILYFKYILMCLHCQLQCWWGSCFYCLPHHTRCHFSQSLLPFWAARERGRAAGDTTTSNNK